MFGERWVYVCVMRNINQLPDTSAIPSKLNHDPAFDNQLSTEYASLSLCSFPSLTRRIYRRPVSLKHIVKELERALQELKSAHSRRIIRNVR